MKPCDQQIKERRHEDVEVCVLLLSSFFSFFVRKSVCLKTLKGVGFFFLVIPELYCTDLEFSLTAIHKGLLGSLTITNHN